MAVAADLLGALQEAARASPDREICGLLAGMNDRIEAMLPAVNVAADPRRAFEVDPQVLIAALRAERDGGASVIGCYHSHPSGDATPSARDIAAAEPGKLWLILGSGEARLWRAEAGRFDEVALRVA